MTAAELKAERPASDESAYGTFAAELMRRFNEAFAESRPPLLAAITPLRDDSAHISVRAIGEYPASDRFRVSYVIPDALEIAWNMMRGVAEGAIAKPR